eukprot:SAG11_NODE_9861_length_874_cov_2.707097_1_plen_75_part_10
MHVANSCIVSDRLAHIIYKLYHGTVLINTRWQKLHVAHDRQYHPKPGWAAPYIFTVQVPGGTCLLDATRILPGRI